MTADAHILCMHSTYLPAACTQFSSMYACRCLMPKKFNRTLWVKRDGFLLIERADGVLALQQTSRGKGECK